MEREDFRIGDEVKVIKSEDKTKLGRSGIVVNVGSHGMAVRYDLPNGKVECFWEPFERFELVKHDGGKVYAKEYIDAEEDRRKIASEVFADFVEAGKKDVERIKKGFKLYNKILKSCDLKIDEHPCMTDEERFGAILDDMLQTFRKKNHDYVNSFSRLYQKWGMKYVLMHLEEKLNRIEQLSEKDAEVKTESIADSLMDAANYCVLTLVELKKSK